MIRPMCAKVSETTTTIEQNQKKCTFTKEMSMTLNSLLDFHYISKPGNQNSDN